MTFEQYQAEAKKTAVYPTIGQSFIYPALGLAGEAGEVVEKVKKIMRNDNGAVSDEKRTEVKKELGDVLWYVSQLATEFGITMEDVASTNVEKLRSRMERGAIHSQGDNR